jgi:hypothetical protein
MNTKHTRFSLYAIAMGLLGLPFLVVANLAAAQATAITGPAANFNPPPCDYSDTFYEDNGLIPAQVVGRFGTARKFGPPATGAQANWVADSTCSVSDPDRRNFRILATTGGFTDDGTGSPNAFISILGFIVNQSAFETTYSRTVGTGGGTIGGPVGPGNTISISNSQNPRGIAMQDIVSNFEAYAMVKQRLPNGVFATNPCAADIASPLAPPTPCFQLNTVNTVYTPNLRQDWRFASNRNAIDGSDNNCVSPDPTVCNPVGSTNGTAPADFNNSPFGYFCDDLLGMWIVTYIWFTVDPAHPGPVCGPIFAALIAKNGANLDGTPIIKTPDETNNQIEANGCGAEGNLETGGEPGGAVDGGAIWLVCPAIPDPRNGAIAADAFLDQVHQPNGAPQNPLMTANFVSLQQTGMFPGGGNGELPPLD